MPVRPMDVQNFLAENKYIFFVFKLLRSCDLFRLCDLLFYSLMCRHFYALFNEQYLNLLNIMKYDFIPCTINSLV